jgi:hypothetical protein
MLNRIRLLEENVDVKQRGMDAISIGIFAGSISSVLVILGGAITLAGGKYEYFTYGAGLFMWLIALSSLIVGLFVYCHILSTALSALPTQSASATVL